MIRINAIPNTAAAKKYYSLSDYLIEGEELTAQWHGKGSELLGLTGEVRQEDFERLCENRHPQTGEQLTAKHLDNRRVGYDFTFSVPKSVSLAYALGGDDRIPTAFRAAVAETMAELEREMSARVRKGGQDTDRTTGNLAWTDFTHHTSRPINGTPDPQLHIHAVVFNATYDHHEDQWKAGQFGELKADAPYWQSVFRARLANRLQGLGYELRKTKDDFELLIPERTIKEFSRRTGLIEKTAELLGVTRPETKAKLGATTREAKKEGQTWASLVKGWNSRVTDSERNAILETVARSHEKPHRPELDNAAALDWAIRHEFERNSVVSERQLVTSALKRGLGSVSPEGILDEMGRRRDLIRRKVKGRDLVTTAGVLGEEKRIVDFAQKHRGRYRPMGDAGRPTGTPGFTARAEADSPDRTTLSRSQQAAIRHVWSSRDRLMIVRGAAGTGKTTMTRAMLEGINVPWVILAPSSEASRGVLRRDGFAEADTLSKFLTDDDLQAKAKGGVIILDESSMAGAHDLSRLVQSADRLNARIVLLGDRRQHKSVSRGDVLALLEDKAGLPVATVSEIKRQSGQYRTAIEQAAKGDVSASYRTLDKLGWIKEGGIDQAVEKYMELKDADVIAPVHAVGREFTTAVRERLKATPADPKKPDGPKRLGNDDRQLGMLTPLHLTEAERSVASNLEGTTAVFHKSQGTFKAGQRVEVTAENSETLAKHPQAFATYMASTGPVATGDHLRITTGGKDVTGKHRLNAGAQYQVAGWTEAGNPRLNNGWVIDREFRGITHGYYRTSHAAQGRTAPHVIVLMPEAALSAADKSQWYVSVSRAKHSATVFTDDKKSLRDAIGRDDPRMLASELVRSPRKGIRHRLKQHVHFLRDIAHRVMGNVREPARVRDMGHERG